MDYVLLASSVRRTRSTFDDEQRRVVTPMKSPLIEHHNLFRPVLRYQFIGRQRRRVSFGFGIASVCLGVHVSQLQRRKQRRRHFCALDVGGSVDGLAGAFVQFVAHMRSVAVTHCRFLIFYSVSPLSRQAVGGGITVVDSEFLQVHSVESGGGIYARNGETELQRVVVDLATTDSNGGIALLLVVCVVANAVVGVWLCAFVVCLRGSRCLPIRVPVFESRKAREFSCFSREILKAREHCVVGASSLSSYQ